jgi:NAD(P)-dependent dehydrogenase (short-subunit alcohol dehydrogenase family)
MGIKAKGYQSNAADFNEAQKLVDNVMAEFGNVDVLINNAGISMRAEMIDVDVEVYKKVMDINFMGAVYCTKLALPSLLWHSAAYGQQGGRLRVNFQELIRSAVRSHPSLPYARVLRTQPGSEARRGRRAFRLRQFPSRACDGQFPDRCSKA